MCVHTSKLIIQNNTLMIKFWFFSLKKTLRNKITSQIAVKTGSQITHYSNDP